MSKPLYFPRGSFHYSDWEAFTKNRSGYIKERFDGGGGIGHLPHIKFGAMLMELMENDPDNELVRDIPRHEFVEYPMETHVGDVAICTHPDSFSENTLGIFEYKTQLLGRNAWTPRGVYKHQQMVFYATCAREKFGAFNSRDNFIVEIPTERISTSSDDSGLEWNIIENEKRKEITRAKGIDTKYMPVILHPRFISEYEVNKMRDSIIATAHELSDLYESFLANQNQL